jgi:hypothetical protein
MSERSAHGEADTAVNTLARAARRAGSATWSERLAVGQALAYLTLADAALRLRGFRRLAPHLRPSTGRLDAATALPVARVRADAIARAARLYPAQAACLQQAAALQLWLRRAGVPALFRIGVCKDGSELRAHAWVEVAGQPLLNQPAEIAQFTPMFEAGSFSTHSVSTRTM